MCVKEKNLKKRFLFGMKCGKILWQKFFCAFAERKKCPELQDWRYYYE